MSDAPQSKVPSSIFESLGSLVDEWLRIPPKGKSPHYQHKSAALYLSNRRPTLDEPGRFIERCYAQIERNYEAAERAGSTSRSSENWRWKRHTDISPQNKSPEVLWERALVNAIPKASNHMPTASGLVSSQERHVAVDLVIRHDDVSFEFIELKVGSNTPLSGAIQVLQYGLLWLWSRAHVERLGYNCDDQPVLRATHVDLRVTAPSTYYRGYDFSFLTGALNDGLQEIAQAHGVDISFGFQTIPATQNAPTHDLVEAFSKRSLIWHTQRL